MKKLILIIGTLLIALNILAGLVISAYAPLNYLLASLSIALSTILIYAVICAKMADGFKIGLTSLFVFTGIMRVLCIALMPAVWKNNVFIIVALCILVFETACVASAWFASKKNES